MRVLLRVLAPVLGLALTVAGVLVAIEVVAAWVRPGVPGLLVPWRDWWATAEQTAWADGPVRWIAVGVGVVGLLLVLVGLAASRHDVRIEGATPAMDVITSPKVLARLVGTQVRAADDVAGATVTASRRRIGVAAQAWGDPSSELRDQVSTRVDEVLADIPLRRRPRVAVSVQERRGSR